MCQCKGGECGWLRKDSGVRQLYIMSPWLFNVFMDLVMKEVKMRMRRRGVRLLDEGKEWGETVD